MKCADALAKIDHPPHWHVVRAGNITWAQGQCAGFGERLDYVDVLRRLVMLVAPSPTAVGPIPTKERWVQDADFTPEAEQLLAEFKRRVNLAYRWSTALRLAVEEVRPR